MAYLWGWQRSLATPVFTLDHFFCFATLFASGSVSRPIGKIMTEQQTDIMGHKEVTLPIIEKNPFKKHFLP